MPPLLHRLRHRVIYPHKIATDLVVWSGAGLVAYLLRFDLTIPVAQRSDMWVYVGVAAVVKLGALLAFRLNVSNWRKVTFRDAVTLGWAVATVTVILLTVTALLRPEVVVPRSIPLLDAGVALLGLAAVRAAGRWRDERVRDGGAQEIRSALIIGAGEAGTLLAREMLRHPEMGLRPVGFVDDDPNKLGMRVGGTPVLGGRDRIAAILASHPVDEVLIATPSADGRFIRETVELVRAAAAAGDRKVQTRVMPGVYELLSGDVSVRRLREVQVEDLLRREPVRMDASAIRGYVDGRTVLVTGAGGSIGSEIARQLAEFAPKELLLLGRGETSLYTIQHELQRTHPGLDFEVLVASVQTPDRLRSLFERHSPEVVFHAAAHKHVPLMEAHPEEAVLNNVLGTRNVVDAALEARVQREHGLEAAPPTLAADIAATQGIPRKFLEAILSDLRRQGYLQSRKGRGGGYRLARPADRVMLGAVLRIFEGPLAPIPCVSKRYYAPCDDCADENDCDVRRTMLDVKRAILAVLDRTSLQAMIDREGEPIEL